MKTLPLLAAGLFALAGLFNSPVHAAETPPVELLTDTAELQPATTLEFRFARPIIARDDIGLIAKDVPVVIAPAVAGQFTWLSRSSGVFAPAQAWPLGGAFTVTLRPGLKAADGKPLAGSFRAALRAPAFAQTAVRGGGGEEFSEPTPTIALAYNSAVDLAGAQKLFQFVDADGRTIAAKVRHGTRRDYISVPPEQDDWEHRWQKARGTALAEPEEAEDEEGSPDEEKPAAPLENRLVVEPTAALTPGGAWRLERGRGLASKDGRHRLAAAWSLPLGKVRPFTIATLRAENYVNSGRSVTLEFSHSLAPDITPETAAKFFRFDPPVPNLRFDGWDSSLTARGDFELGREYRVDVDAAVISTDALPFAGERRRTFQFAPVVPRLYLPAITGHQIRSGQRKFDVLSANLAGLRVVARTVAPAQAAAAIEAFKKYESDGGDEGGESYLALPEGLIRAQVVAERRIELPRGAVDARQQTSLDWNELVGAQKAGVIFLTVEGEPLAEVGGKRPGAQALIQLTDLGVLWKKVAEGIRVDVFSMDTGRPLAAAGVALLDPKFLGTANAVTDATGTATLALAAEPGWLVVSRGDDVHALRLGPGGSELPMSAFRLPIDYRAWDAPAQQPRQLRAFIFTDRPLYRPGETVRVKGYVRESGNSALAFPVGLTGTLKLANPRGQDVSETAIKLDARGAFDAEIALGGGANGTHSVQLEITGVPGTGWRNGFRASFEVADFQPNAFEVDLALAARLAPDAPVRAPLTAKYFFGAPLTRADVRWTLRYVRETFAPEGFESWIFGDSDGAAGKTLTLRGEGKLGGAEPLLLQPQLPAAKDAPHRGVLSVEVTDINQQTVSESRPFVRDAADFYLGASVPEGVVFRPGEPVAVRVVAVRPGGQPLAQPVEISAELIHVRHETVRVQGAGKAIAFRTDKIEEPIAQAAGRTLVPIRQNQAWEVRDGASVTFQPERAGSYRVRLTAQDAAGRAVSSVLPVFVTGREEIAWDYRNPAQLDLVADKAEYRPGDTARLLLKTPISGEGLVTIERDDRILRTMRVKLEGNAPVLEIPLEKTDAPNVFVSLVLIRGREQSTHKFKTPEYRYGVAMLRVSDPAERLQVDVKPARPEAEAGSEVDVEVQVHDGAGAAVADAEVTFFAVDDGILALTGYTRPAPGELFHAPFSLGVRTGLTLFELLVEDPAALEFANKGYLIGGGGLEGPGLKLRRDFPGTACWFPALRTNAAGLVRVKFRAPDALTRYRLVAVAHAGSRLFGSGESAFAIRQPLMLLPALGQFANVGDELLARAVVRNESGTDGTVEVTLALDETAQPVKPGADATRAQFALRNGEARTVDFPVRLRAMGRAEWKWQAQLAAGGRTFDDQVVTAINVGSAAPLLRETYLTEPAAATNDLLAGVNPQLLEGAGKVTVTLSNTRLASLQEGVNRLLEYPYGCAEQTVSALIPWALLPALRPVLPELAKNPADTKAAIGRGLDRLFSMQTPGGGIAYWPGGREPSLFASAYAALACSLLAKQDGVELPAGHKPLLDYLSAQLRGTAGRPAPSLDDRALTLYALAAAGQAEPAYHEELFRRRKDLSAESRALLALAIHESGGPAAMIATLLDPKVTAPEASSWFGGAARERAIQLLAWSAHQPRAGEVGRLVKELLGYRTNGHWGTTQQNAWALLALARYYAAAEQGSPDVRATLAAAGREIPVALSAARPTATDAFAFTPEQPLAKLAALNPAKGQLFGETRFVVRPLVAAQPAQNRGYAVARSYRKLGDDGALAEAANLKVGDRVLVTLRVETVRPGHFVAIDDPLPAIFEAVNPAFKNSEAAGQPAEREWASDHREIRADRVLYFCDHLPTGAYTFRYLARVRSAGTATAGPTKVEEMYRPERFGLGETTALTSRVAEEK